MGGGIAQVFAQHHYPTILYDLNREMLHRAQSAITGSLQQLTERNKINAEEKAAILSGNARRIWGASATTSK